MTKAFAPFLFLAFAAAVGAWFVSAAIAGEQPVAAIHDRAVQIEAGWFVMGSDDSDVQLALSLCNPKGNSAPKCSAEQFGDEQPAHRVYLSRYLIDREETSQKAYDRCVLAGVCAPSRVATYGPEMRRPEYPVTGVTWAQAQRYCEWVGGSLPTEAQWERAARGRDGRAFPWGRRYDAHLANHANVVGDGEADRAPSLAPVTAFSAGKASSGLLNMAGNVWEFTRDHYALDQYRSNRRVDPTGPKQGEDIVIRGGSWLSPPHQLRVTERERIGENESRIDVGFRCAYSAPQQ